MLTFRNTTIILLVTLLSGWLMNFSLAGYLIVFALYITALVQGSYRVSSQFYLPSICSARTAGNKIAISFDDGPADRFTPELLDILREKNVPAAFFCIGNRVRGKEALLERMGREGHIIGNHSFSHSHFFDLYSAARMTGDLRKANDSVEEATGLRPRFFRPPYGVTTPNMARAVKALGLTTIGWNIRSLDTVTRNPDKILTRVLRSLRPGSIVLFHDTVEATCIMLPSFIDEARKRGFEIVRIDYLINERAYE